MDSWITTTSPAISDFSNIRWSTNTIDVSPIMNTLKSTYIWDEQIQPPDPFEQTIIDKIKKVCDIEDVDGGFRITLKSHPDKKYYLYKDGSSGKEMDNETFAEMMDLLLTQK